MSAQTMIGRRIARAVKRANRRSQRKAKRETSATKRLALNLLRDAAAREGET